MTPNHEGGTSFHEITAEHAHPVNQLIAVSTSFACEGLAVNTALQKEEKDEEPLKAPGVKLSHAPRVVEDESFYVSLLRSLFDLKVLTIND
jgi:hypothetical protein